MRLLQRHLMFDLVRVFVAVVSVLTVLLVFVGVFQQVNESGLGMGQVLQILPYVVPSLLPFTIPATLLLTVCLVYGRMAGDSEITAAKAAGINVFSLLWPSLLLAAVLSVGSFVLSDRIIPWAVANIQQTVANAVEEIFLDVLRNRHKVSDPRKGYEITVTGVEGKTLIDPTFQYSRGGSPVTMQAKRGELEFDLDNQQVVLHLVAGSVEAPGGQRLTFEREDRAFPMPTEIVEQKTRNMPIGQLTKRVAETTERIETDRDRRAVLASMAYISGDFASVVSPEERAREAALQADVYEQLRSRTEIHGRYALSASCFFFVLLGAPVAILQGRTQFLTTFLACFLPILLAYYPIVLGMMSLSKSGTVDPQWAMWVGNGAMLVCGAYFLRRVLRY